MARVYYVQNGTADSSIKYKRKRATNKRISCSLLNLLIILFTFIVLYIVSILVTYLFAVTSMTKDIQPLLNSSDFQKYNVSLEEISESEENEESIATPTPEELRLPKDIIPICVGLNLPENVNDYDILVEGVNTDSQSSTVPKEAPTVVGNFSKEVPGETSEELSNIVENFSKEIPEEFSEESPTVFEEFSSEFSEPNITTRFKRLINRSPSGISVTKITVNETLEKVIFDLDGDLEEDKEYIFQFRYKGQILKKMVGLYLTTYHDPEGKSHYAVATHMQPANARRMVPCFDEPEFRAIWRVKVFHPQGSKAVSNAMEITEDQVDQKIPGFLWTSFEETPKMSSYLLAIVISDFDFIEGYTDKGTRIRVWSKKEAINETQYALHTGIKVLEFYEDYYGINFPLQKQDMIAIPDFTYGGMENWGLIIYRERALLYNPDVYTLVNKRYVTRTVTHELAHQWFGNLVTMKWWNDLWLNEGFATLIENIGADAINPSFKMDEWFIQGYLSSAFERDAMATSHPLSFPIEKAEDVVGAFDFITYHKGGSFLRMLKNILGEDNFKKGLNIYLNRYAYSNAEHKDLFQALNEAVPDSLRDWSGQKLDVDDFAKKWTEQMGYPVVTVSTTKNGVKLTQKRFKMDETSEESPKLRNPKYWYKWDIPIWYTIDGSRQPMTWLHSEEEINLTNPDSLIFVNSESTGFYRVKYDHDQMKKINKQLLENHTAIQMRSRARYIDDAFNLAQAGSIPYEEVLEITRYLDKEKEYLPMAIAIKGFESIAGYFGDEPESEYLRAYLKPMFAREYDKIKEKFFEEEDFNENEISTLIVHIACNLRNEDCIDRALKLYHEKFTAPCQNNSETMSSHVPVNVRDLVYCLGVKYGSERDWNNVFHLLQKESVQVEHDRLIRALSCSRDTLTLKKLLKMAVDVNDTIIPLNDKNVVFGLVRENFIGKSIVFKFFTENWSQIYTDLKDQQKILNRCIESSLGGSTWERVKEVEEFLAANKATTQNLDIFQRQLETIRTNAKWMEKNYDNLTNWFKNASDSNMNKREVDSSTV
ncbi:hypothetical protein FO519_009470, partial [Halicephalobus sp. NKZ332]